MNESILEKYTEMFRDRKDLPEADAPMLFDAAFKETNEAAIHGLLSAWHSKGYSAEELYGLARVMRERCVPVRSSHDVFVDAVGTGGSKIKTFNVSTAAAFVAAGAGVPVAKHGNRAATSNSGSADVLAELGVNIAAGVEAAERCLNEFTICFMFAPKFHQLSPTLAKVRRELGFPTIFNNLGPLCNPAGAPHQVIGVNGRDILSLTATVLFRLGTRRSWVVCGSDGLDEITLNGPTSVMEVSNGTVNEFEVHPDDFGLAACDIANLRVDSPARSARLILGILDGSVNGGARDLVLINAAAAIFVSGRAESLAEAGEMALESVQSGRARRKLQQLANATNE